MNLQEQVNRIQEMMGLNESNFLSAVQRRIRNVDELIFVSADEVNVQYSMCEIDEDDFIDATISKTLNTIYWDYFSDVSDSFTLLIPKYFTAVLTLSEISSSISLECPYSRE